MSRCHGNRFNTRREMFITKIRKEKKKRKIVSSSCYVIRFPGIRDDVLALLVYVVCCKFVALCILLSTSWLFTGSALIAYRWTDRWMRGFIFYLSAAVTCRTHLIICTGVFILVKSSRSITLKVFCLPATPPCPFPASRCAIERLIIKPWSNQ